jgi:acetylornithine deacetylase/succinyl-diaminopimelate desuccinylase-like protein
VVVPAVVVAVVVVVAVPVAAPSVVAVPVATTPVVAPEGSELYPVLERAIRDHDPEAAPVPAMAPFSTDAKHLVDLGVPVFGFSPLRLEPGDGYLDRWHGIDERVSFAALRWGLPVLYDAVRRFCG